MNLAEAISRFVVGGSIILFISLLSETKYKILSGLFVLFPAVTVVGYYYYSLEVSQTQLESTVLFSLVAVPAVVAYLVTFYLSIQRFSVPVSLGIGIVGWLVAAAAIVFINQQLLGLG